MKRHTTILTVLLALTTACGDQDIALEPEEISLYGKWRFVSHVLTHCDNDSENSEDLCTDSAAECGILTLAEGTWSWIQILPDESTFEENGTFSLVSNSIILTSAEKPGIGSYSISGSTVAFTKTALTLTNYGISNGCTYTDTYARYNQSVVPPK